MNDHGDDADPLVAADDLVGAADRMRTMLQKARQRVNAMVTSRAVVREQQKLGRALLRLDALVERANEVCAMAREMRANLRKPRR